MTSIQLFIFLVATLIHESLGQTCRKSGSSTQVGIHDCGSGSFAQLSQNFEAENFVGLDAGNKTNNFPTLDNSMFQKMTNLAELELSGCKIKKIDESAFSQLTKLEKLTIDHNELEVIHRSSFKRNQKLKVLLLDSNKIHSVAEGTFDELTKLAWLNLYENLCINKRYGSSKSQVLVILSQVSSDLNNCYSNYALPKNTIMEISPKTSSDSEPNHSKITPISPEILALILAILTVVGKIFIITVIQKIKKIFKEDNERQEIEMRNRESGHYYSKADTPAQIEHAQWRQLEQELKSE
jgi:hypothetical protein